MRSGVPSLRGSRMNCSARTWMSCGKSWGLAGRGGYSKSSRLIPSVHAWRRLGGCFLNGRPAVSVGGRVDLGNPERASVGWGDRLRGSRSTLASDGFPKSERSRRGPGSGRRVRGVGSRSGFVGARQGALIWISRESPKGGLLQVAPFSALDAVGWPVTLGRGGRRQRVRFEPKTPPRGKRKRLEGICASRA